MSDNIAVLPTNTAIADHLFISPGRVTQLQAKGILPKNPTLDQAREAYIKNLQQLAAGRGDSEHHQEVARQKARQLQADANLKELEYWTKIGKLVAVDVLAPVWESWAIEARTEVENSVHALINAIESEHGCEIPREQIDGALDPAFRAIAEYAGRLGGPAESSSEEMAEA